VTLGGFLPDLQYQWMCRVESRSCAIGSFILFSLSYPLICFGEDCREIRLPYLSHKFRVLADYRAKTSEVSYLKTFLDMRDVEPAKILDISFS
jgi:hypothetical protein